MQCLKALRLACCRMLGLVLNTDTRTWILGRRGFRTLAKTARKKRFEGSVPAFGLKSADFMYL